METPISPDDAGRTQSLFREINDKIRPPLEHGNGDRPSADYVCECANGDCLELVTLTVGEYTTIRETPTYFVVAPNYLHVVPEAERIIGKTDRYWIVEKLSDAAKIAVDESAPSGVVDGQAA